MVPVTRRLAALLWLGEIKTKGASSDDVGSKSVKAKPKETIMIVSAGKHQDEVNVFFAHVMPP